ncbi:unnamed protein product [Umbelopsis vinacea]
MSIPPALWRPQGQLWPSEYCLETGKHSAGFSFRQFETTAIKKPNRRPMYHRSVSPDSLYYTHSTPSPILKKSIRHSRRSAFRRPVPKPSSSSSSSSSPFAPLVVFNSLPPPLQQFSTKPFDHFEQEDVPQLTSDQSILDDMETWTQTMRTAPGMLSPPSSPLSSMDDLSHLEEDFVLFP